MRYLLFICLAFLSLSVFSQDTKQELDSIVSHFHSGQFFSGVVLAAKNGEVVFTKGYGLADAAAGTKHDDEMIFPIGSVSKQFTATAIMKLQEEGKLSVIDPLSKYFPELKHADKITIHHLLTHTSGLYNYTNDTSIWYGKLWEEKLVKFLNDKALDFEPGSKYQYSNSGYALLGYIIEKQSGKKYEAYIRNQFFYPLGMKDSGFDFINLSSPKKTKGYYDNGTMNIEARPIDSSISYAAGGIYSTVHDMYKWVQALKDQEIVNAASLMAMITPYKDGYGYGLVMDNISGSQRIWHNGQLDGFVSHVSYMPEENITVIILSNYMPSKLSGLNDALLLALMDKPYKLPSVRKAISLPVETLKEYEGQYQLVPGFIITVKADGERLKAQATGQPDFEIYAEKKDFFFYKVIDAQIEFERDEAGKVISLFLYQHGMKQKASKIQ